MIKYETNRPSEFGAYSAKRRYSPRVFHAHLDCSVAIRAFQPKNWPSAETCGDSTGIPGSLSIILPSNKINKPRSEDQKFQLFLQ
jgi:hypothetical protein